MPTKRIEYIDALRGFTMILVVFAHVETFVLSIQPNSTLVSELFIAFRMPLFFFISGFISYKKDTIWSSQYYIHSLIKKIKAQLIPTLFFGLSYTYLFSIGNVSDFIDNGHKFGYWFTICLLGIFMILYTSNFLIYSCFKKHYKIISLVVLILVTAVLTLFKFVYDKHPLVAEISDMFCFHQICVYFPFFFFGYFVSHDKECFYRFLDNCVVQLCIFILFIITFYCKRTLPDSIYNINVVLLLYRSIQDVIIGLLGICIVFNFFRKTTLFSKGSSSVQLLRKIGTRTLDIYMLHYFFLSEIPSIGGLISVPSNLVLELLFVFSLSMIVITLCLLVSNLLRMSKFLSSILLGVKIN